jgi:hypothetical protein
VFICSNLKQIWAILPTVRLFRKPVTGQELFFCCFLQQNGSNCFISSDKILQSPSLSQFSLWIRFISELVLTTELIIVSKLPMFHGLMYIDARCQEKSLHTMGWNNFCRNNNNQCLNVSITPITAMGCQQCLSLSVVQLKGKHCWKPHCCIMGL